MPGCDGVTFFSCREKVDAPGFARNAFSTVAVDLRQDEEMLWKNIDFWTRKKINKARNNGVEIKINSNYQEFYDLYRAFRHDKGLIPYSLDPDFMKKYGTLFVASLNGEIVSGHFFLSDEHNLRGMITGSKRLEVNRHTANVIGHANRLIVWEAMRHAREKGIGEYDMGGYFTAASKDMQMERVNAYKMSFGGKVTVKYHYEKSYTKLFGLAQYLYNASMYRLNYGRFRDTVKPAAPAQGG